MRGAKELEKLLFSIDRKSYGAYKSLQGRWSFDSYILSIDHVQGDPFASPSNISVEIGHNIAQFPPAYYNEKPSRIALQDYLIRQIQKQFETYNFKAKGSGKSGLMSITHCGQEVIERSACTITSSSIIVRFFVGFPAYGRTICADELHQILFDFLPRCVGASLHFESLNADQVRDAIFLFEDQESLRSQMRAASVVSFVANDSVLPRRSGVSDLPMEDSVPFVSPPSLERTFSLPHSGEVRGMAVPAGITLIVGGGYHGKSTLLEAIQMGVYNHVRGDGREFVVTEDSALKLRAEDGRCVKNVDISMFINNLPNRKDTRAFSSEDASGSTSQAASLVEGLEAGAKLLLVDEDTSATNFMVRDELMQRVIGREGEPITPFLERARDLLEGAGVSTILVAGSSGAFFFVADVVVQMDGYRPVDITAAVREACEGHPAPRTRAPGFAVPGFRRVVAPFRGSAAAGRRGRGRGRPGGRGDRLKVRSSGVESFSIDHEEVSVRAVEQITDREQTEAIANMIRFAFEEVVDGRKTLQQVCTVIESAYNSRGWISFSGSYVPCGMALPRKQELFASFNRFRG